MKIDDYSCYKVQPVSRVYETGNNRPPEPPYFRQITPTKYADPSRQGDGLVNSLA